MFISLERNTEQRNEIVNVDVVFLDYAPLNQYVCL
jgi:hypothetical protein